MKLPMHTYFSQFFMHSFFVMTGRTDDYNLIFYLLLAQIFNIYPFYSSPLCNKQLPSF